MPAVIAMSKDEKAEAERLRIARVREEHNSMAHIERLQGVKEVRTGMEWHEYREVDSRGNEKVEKRARLTADAELADGRVIRADATNAVDLQRSLFKKVKEALREDVAHEIPAAMSEVDALRQELAALKAEMAAMLEMTTPRGSEVNDALSKRP